MNEQEIKSKLKKIDRQLSACPRCFNHDWTLERVADWIMQTVFEGDSKGCTVTHNQDPGDIREGIKFRCYSCGYNRKYFGKKPKHISYKFKKIVMGVDDMEKVELY